MIRYLFILVACFVLVPVAWRAANTRYAVPFALLVFVLAVVMVKTDTEA